MAITKFDQFDFLIDIVPRDDIKPKREEGTQRTSGNPDQVHYYLQLAQQHHASLQQNSTSPTTTAATNGTAQTSTIQIVQPQQVQTVQVNPVEVVRNVLWYEGRIATCNETRVHHGTSKSKLCSKERKT